MRRRILTSVLLAIALSGCDAFYYAAQDAGCWERHYNAPDADEAKAACVEQRPTYEEYERERQRMLRGK